MWAVYAEVVAPVTKWLELSAALRYDHYSDFGSSTNPKFGFRVRPHEQVLLRGTYSEAFRAPGPAEIGGSSFGFTTFGILSQGNPNIQPETAKSTTLGVVWEPRAGTNLTFDYWWFDRENEIVQADPNTIIGSLPIDRRAFHEDPRSAAEYVHLLRRGWLYCDGHWLLPQRLVDEDRWLRLLRDEPPANR